MRGEGGEGYTVILLNTELYSPLITCWFASMLDVFEEWVACSYM